ncbi:MAG: hypothetical protein I4O51_09505 [Flavobacterium micromati]|nr:hypothetical protein [Flavobacterium micromati]
MRLFRKLIFHFVGDICKWIYYAGQKTMDEVIENDNSALGIIVIVFFIFVMLGFRN